MMNWNAKHGTPCNSLTIKHGSNNLYIDRSKGSDNLYIGRRKGLAIYTRTEKGLTIYTRTEEVVQQSMNEQKKLKTLVLIYLLGLCSGLYHMFSEFQF